MNINWKLIIGKGIKVFLSGFVAGVILSLAGFIYFFVAKDGDYSSIIFASLLSSSVLLLIPLYGYNLFIYKVGHIFDNNKLYIVELIISFIGNYLALFIIGIILHYSNITQVSGLEHYVNASKTLLPSFLGSIGCGLLLYFAFNTYKKAEQPIARFLVFIMLNVITLVLPLKNMLLDVMVFNWYKAFDGSLNVILIYTFFGNVLGTLLIPLYNLLRSKIKSIN